MKRSTIALFAAIPLLATLPRLGSDYATGIALNVAMWIALVESWSVLSALTGYISLGHVAFYGLGAYIVVLGWDHLPLYATIPLAGVVAAAFAMVIGAPVLRVRGPYFVVLTFGISELLKYSVLAYETASGVASRILFNAPQLETIYYMLLALAVAAALLMAWVAR